jgi:predicted TIM-barrel fold metal-dependent hydrolase
MSEQPARVIDCAVHCHAPALESLYPYLSEHWPEYLGWSEFDSPPVPYPAWSRMLSTTPFDSSLEKMREGPLHFAAHAILACTFGIEHVSHPYLAPELARAVNEWIRDEWLGAEERLLASAVIAPEYPDAAIAEIERVASDRRFVQVLLPARSGDGYGKQRYWPIWEAAARHNLVLGITFGTRPGPSTYFGSYVNATLNFETQVSSLVLGGVLDQIPSLRFAILESGWTWVPSFMWRMDADWKQFRREVPWMVDPPSVYVRRHFRFTTQPTDAPADTGQLGRVLDQLGGDELAADELLMYSSDFPHVYTHGIERLLEHFDDRQADRVLSVNAAGWYGLEVS